MIDAVSKRLKQDCRLDRSGKVLVGVSAGPDSLCLLDILRRLDYPIIIAHLNHSLRQEADSEAEKIADLAESWGIPGIVEKVDVPAYAHRNGLSIEEAARIVRYKFLFTQAHDHQAQAVAVGHTADDQVETVLMHFLRGAGLSGLRGMLYHSLPNPWSEQIPIIRPLLDIWRDEILTYIVEQGLEPAMDHSNLDVKYYRNRLRHELIPYLQGYNPAIKQVLWRTSQVLAGDYLVLQQEIEAALKACLLDRGDGFISFELSALRNQSKGIQRHLLRKGIAWLCPGLRDIDYETVERARKFVLSPTRTGESDLAAGLRIFVEGGQLWLVDSQVELPHNEWPYISEGRTFELDIPQELPLGGDWMLLAQEVQDVNKSWEDALHNRDPYQAWISADRLQVPLTIRGRVPGDRIRPLGMGGRSMKLAHFMVNLKIPRRARQGWPLLLSAGEIVWVPGYRLGYDFRLRSTTRRAIYMRLMKG